MRPPPRQRLLARLLLLLGSIGLAGATWGPWVAFDSPGLTLLGIDLAEYVKFLPEVRSGALHVAREQFYLPLFTLSVGLSLLSLLGAPWLHYRPARLLLALLAVPCALALLPPAWSPATFGQAEFQPQIRMLIVALVLALIGLLTPGWRQRYGRQALAILLAVLALAATLLPLWQWSRVRPAIEVVYQRSSSLGWGGWALLLGGMALTAGALLLAWSERAPDA